MAESESFPLHDAAREGKVLIVKGLLSENPQLIFKRDLDGRTALHWAASLQQEEIMSLLLNPHKIVASGLSGSESEAQSSTKKMSEIEIDDMTDDSGWTPLHIAASIGNLNILRQLLTHSPAPNVDLTTNLGQTCLHFASAKNHYDTVQELLNHKASARIKDKRGQFPLHRAASIGSQPIIKLLTGPGKAAINAKDNQAWTALHHALSEGHGDVGVLLVKLGADPTIENSDNEKPIQVAVDEKVATYFKTHLKNDGLTRE